MNTSWKEIKAAQQVAALFAYFTPFVSSFAHMLFMGGVICAHQCFFRVEIFPILET
jgi:hypothetical protein